ncbi:MAG: hypothetical protein RLZZ292_717 [Bacteroidota bacterium]|jgi:ferric-dicitrate binding protein FerR (iron transport regulator)
MSTEKLIDILYTNRFKDWVFNPTDVALNSFWNNWLIEHPTEKEEVIAFKTLIFAMHQPNNSSSFDEKAERTLWTNILASIEKEEEKGKVSERESKSVREEESKSVREAEREEKEFSLKIVAIPKSDSFIIPKSNIRNPKSFAIAASLLFLVGVSLFLFKKTTPYNNTVTLQTAYGETQNVKLPDGSDVTLNANSTISYPKTWTIGEDRNVTLKGEAFFVVNEQGTSAHHDRFIVHTAELDVQVLGTRFNVNTYHPQTQVVLQKGSVEIVTKQNKQEKKYNLVPGQRAIFDKQKDVVEIAPVNSNAYIGWKDKKFIFDNTPLSEVALMIENTYGIKVSIQEKELAAKKISGEIPINEKKSLFLALSTLYSLKIEEQGNKLTISR